MVYNVTIFFDEASLCANEQLGLSNMVSVVKIALYRPGELNFSRSVCKSAHKQVADIAYLLQRSDVVPITCWSNKHAVTSATTYG